MELELIDLMCYGLGIIIIVLLTLVTSLIVLIIGYIKNDSSEEDF